jgi:hypothetical protein
LGGDKCRRQDWSVNPESHISVVLLGGEGEREREREREARRGSVWRKKRRKEEGEE